MSPSNKQMGNHLNKHIINASTYNTWGSVTTGKKFYNLCGRSWMPTRHDHPGSGLADLQPYLIVRGQRSRRADSRVQGSAPQPAHRIRSHRQPYQEYYTGNFSDFYPARLQHQKR